MLDESLRTLHHHEVERGFVPKDLRYFRIPGPADRHWIVSTNPGRGSRPSSLPGTCPLCEAIRTGQPFVPLILGGRSYRALATPFPMMPTHLTVAALEHAPQPGADARAWAPLIADALALSTQLPGWVVIVNGIDAGASIPDHRHVQVLIVPSGLGPLPLQRAIAPRALGGPRLPLRDYPIPVYRIEGRPEEIVRECGSLMDSHVHRLGPDATFNVLVQCDDGSPVLFMVPRSRVLQRPLGYSATMGSLEAAGCFIVPVDEAQAAAAGLGDYARLGRYLAAVCPPHIAVW